MAADTDPLAERLSTPAPEDASSYGVTLSLVGAVLLTLAYYGVLGVQAGRSIGDALPEPFYLLAIAFLFVLELLARRTLSVQTLARALTLAAVYGTLFVFAVEGGALLYEQPELALDGFAGVTVFAVSLVVSVLAYVGYLTLIDTS